MAAPNIISITGLTLKSTATALSSTSATVVVACTASSGQVRKVTYLSAANVDGTNATSVSLSLNSSGAGGGTSYRFAHTVALPAKSAIALITRTNPVYLEEDRSLVATAGSTDDVDIVAVYEQSS